MQTAFFSVSIRGVPRFIQESGNTQLHLQIRKKNLKKNLISSHLQTEFVLYRTRVHDSPKKSNVFLMTIYIKYLFQRNFTLSHCISHLSFMNVGTFVQQGQCTLARQYGYGSVVKLVPVIPERCCGEALPQRVFSCLGRILKTLTRFRKRSLVKPPLQLKSPCSQAACEMTHVFKYAYKNPCQGARANVERKTEASLPHCASCCLLFK